MTIKEASHELWKKYINSGWLAGIGIGDNRIVMYLNEMPLLEKKWLENFKEYEGFTVEVIVSEPFSLSHGD